MLASLEIHTQVVGLEYKADIVTRMKSAADEPEPATDTMPLFDGI